MTINPWDKTEVTDLTERYVLAKNGVSPDDVLAYEDQGILNRGEMILLAKAEITPANVKTYADQGVTLATDMVALKKERIVASTLTEFRKAFPGISIADAVKLRKAGIAKAFLVAMKRLDVTDVDEMVRLAKRYTGAEITEWIRKGATAADFAGDERPKEGTIILRSLDALDLAGVIRWPSSMLYGHPDVEERIAYVREIVKIVGNDDDVDDWLSGIELLEPVRRNGDTIASRHDGLTFEQALRAARAGLRPSRDTRESTGYAYINVKVSKKMQVLARLLPYIEDSQFEALVAVINECDESMNRMAKAHSYSYSSKAENADLRWLCEDFDRIRYLDQINADFTMEQAHHDIIDSGEKHPYAQLWAAIADSIESGDEKLWREWYRHYKRSVDTKKLTATDRHRIRKDIIAKAKLGVSTNEYEALKGVGVPESEMRAVLDRASEGWSVVFTMTVDAEAEPEPEAPEYDTTDDEWEASVSG